MNENEMKMNENVGKVEPSAEWMRRHEERMRNVGIVKARGEGRERREVPPLRVREAKDGGLGGSGEVKSRFGEWSWG